MSSDVDTPPVHPSGRVGPAWLGHGWIGPIVLAATLAFLAGAIGYVIAGSETMTEPASEADIGFLRDMADHHDQAVVMSILATENANDRTVRDFAREVIIFQRYELGIMDLLLDEMGSDRGDPERRAMTWMGMDSSVAEMDGMATEEQLEELRTTTGLAADILFLELMIEHHRGGLHMAEEASRTADNPRVRRLAEQIVALQTGEIEEYQGVLKRLQAQQAAEAEASVSGG